MGTKAIPIYIPAKRPRIGTIGKNHIQSSSNLSGTALFVVCSESDTFLKNFITIREILYIHIVYFRTNLLFKTQNKRTELVSASPGAYFVKAMPLAG